LIHNDVQNQLQLLLKVSAPPLIEVSEAPLQGPQLVPGERVQAHVLANLPNGRFQVLVKEQVLDMNLPRNTQTGEKLDLTLISSQPRLTFALTRDLPQVPGQRADVSISDTAKYLGALLQKTAQPSTPQQTMAAGRTAPVLPEAPRNAEQLAVGLRNALAQSGLFYESHQAEWLTGSRPLASLLQEPQGQLSKPATLAAHGVEAKAAQEMAEGQTPPKASGVLPDRVPASNPANAPTRESLSHAAQGTAAGAERTTTGTTGIERMSMGSQGTATGTERMSAGSEPVRPQVLPLVQQQLDALDTRQVMWQGQVWPGQYMDWRIQDDGVRREASAEQAAGWQTRLHLVFPKLGEVTAVLSLNQKNVAISFHVTENVTGDLVRDHQGALQTALDAVGLSLAGVTVVKHEEA
jgi:hypothetical protein